MYTNIKAYSQKSFIEFYNQIGGKKKYSNNKIIFDVINFQNIQITFYNNLTILFNGQINNELNKYIDIIIDHELYVGSDEVGVGESIGPIVVVAVKFKSYNSKKEVILNGIKDSKKLNAQEIIKKAYFIKKHVEYYSIIMEPKKFNKVYETLPNVKAINALMQNELHKKFTNKNYKHVTDQFVNKNKYLEYIKNSNNELFSGELMLLPKAEEQYLEVAAAAIIAKDMFNDWVLSELKKDGINYKIENKLNSWQIFQDIKINKNIIDKYKYIKNWNKKD